MEVIPLGKSSLKTSRLAYGCWRLAGVKNSAEVTIENIDNAKQAIITAYESGFTFFDHADVYCQGFAETIFGNTLKEVSSMRENISIATKCGIRGAGDPWSDSPHRYDFSAEYIVRSCEASLKRLGIECIDLMFLHRPDFLCNPEEVAEAFSQLLHSGKVAEFGVSNFRPSLVTALQKSCSMPLVVHQVEISLARLDAFDDGTLDQCMAEKMVPLAWSPLGGGVLGSPEKALGEKHRHHISVHAQETLQAIAEARDTSRAAIALAWLLKHPSRIVPIVGSVNPERIREAARAVEIDLTRDEWYRLFVAARGEKLP